MEKLVLSKGVALMIRAILNIDPAKIEAQINDVIGKAELAFSIIKNSAADFDKRIAAVEKSNIALADANQAVLNILQRWENERRDFNSKPTDTGKVADTGSAGNRTATG
jgi:hypothetical protein